MVLPGCDRSDATLSGRDGFDHLCERTHLALAIRNLSNCAHGVFGEGCILAEYSALDGSGKAEQGHDLADAGAGEAFAAGNGGLRARQVELAQDSEPWPCDYAAAKTVRLRVPAAPPPPKPRRPGVRVAEADLKVNEIQDLADAIGELVKLATGHELKLGIRIEIGGDSSPSDELIRKLNEIMKDVSTTPDWNDPLAKCATEPLFASIACAGRSRRLWQGSRERG